MKNAKQDQKVGCAVSEDYIFATSYVNFEGAGCNT
jgi:hypothetical protein